MTTVGSMGLVPGVPSEQTMPDAFYEDLNDDITYLVCRSCLNPDVNKEFGTLYDQLKSKPFELYLSLRTRIKQHRDTPNLRQAADICFLNICKRKEAFQVFQEEGVRPGVSQFRSACEQGPNEALKVLSEGGSVWTPEELNDALVCAHFKKMPGEIFKALANLGVDVEKYLKQHLPFDCPHLIDTLMADYPKDSSPYSPFSNAPLSREEEERIRKELSGKKIFVCTEIPDGLGDYAGALQTLKYLRNFIPLENLGFIHEDNGWDKVFNHPFANYYQKRPIESFFSLPTLQDNDEDILQAVQKEKPSLVIFSPFFLDERVQNYINAKIQVLQVSELTCKPAGKPDCSSFGFGSDDMGFPVHPELEKWSRDKRNFEELQRLKELERLPKEVQVAILEKEFSVAASEAFAKSSKLYLGYANGPKGSDEEILEYQRGFITGMIKGNRKCEDDRDLCFYFMGKEKNDEAHFLMTPDFQNKLKELNIREVELIGFTSEKESPYANMKKTTYLNLGVSGKKIRIIQAKTSPDDVPGLLKASEQFVLATGDQFMCESISARKRIIYQANVHKFNLLWQFKDNIKHHHHLSKLYEDCYRVPINHCYFGQLDNYGFNDDNISEYLFQLESNSDLAAQWDQAIDKLISERAFGPRFIRTVHHLAK